jgi:hypothetical protein
MIRVNINNNSDDGHRESLQNGFYLNSDEADCLKTFLMSSSYNITRQMGNSPKEWYKSYEKLLVWCSGQINIRLH